jgi:hypothetical protein
MTLYACDLCLFLRFRSAERSAKKKGRSKGFGLSVDVKGKERPALSKVLVAPGSYSVSFVDNGVVLATATAVVSDAEDGSKLPVRLSKRMAQTSPVLASSPDRRKPRMTLSAPLPPLNQPMDWSEWDLALKADTVATVQVSFRENGNIASFCSAKIPKAYLTEMIRARGSGSDRKIVLPRSVLKVSAATPPVASAEVHEPVTLRLPHGKVAKSLDSPPQIDDKPALHCVCQQPEDPDDLYLQCDACSGWFHPECLGYTAAEARLLVFLPISGPRCRVCAVFAGTRVGAVLLWHLRRKPHRLCQNALQASSGVKRVLSFRALPQRENVTHRVPSPRPINQDGFRDFSRDSTTFMGQFPPQSRQFCCRNWRNSSAAS